MAGQVTLVWTANTEPDLAGYKIYHGYRSGSYHEVVDVGLITATYDAANQLVYYWQGLPSGGATHYFVVTAYDTSANESVASNEVSKKLDDVYHAGNRFVQHVRSW